MNPKVINSSCSVVEKSKPLGNDKFKDEVEQLMGLDVGYTKRVWLKNEHK